MDGRESQRQNLWSLVPGWVWLDEMEMGVRDDSSLVDNDVISLQREYRRLSREDEFNSGLFILEEFRRHWWRCLISIWMLLVWG